MVFAPKRPCAHPGCRRLVDRGRCAEHAREKERGRYNADTRHWYSTERWKRLRRAQLMKQPLCEECEKGDRVTPATDVDHTVPHRGDPVLFWDPANLGSMCHACHSRKTQAGL